MRREFCGGISSSKTPRETSLLQFQLCAVRAVLALCFHSTNEDNQTMTATNSEIIKRRRISSSFSDDHAPPPPQNIRDLAVEPLTHVASFLPYASRAMFAIGLSSDLSDDAGDDETEPSIIWWINHEIDEISSSSAKIAGKCDNLDFGDIEEDLAGKLTDNHLDKILLSLDRVDNRIKTLRLTNCANMTGVGLKRLSCSSTIEQIDLSMAPFTKGQRC